MRWLLFLSRLAFICGIFFLLSLSLLFKDWLKDQTLVSSVVTIGYFMGMIIVPVTNLCYLAVYSIRRKLAVWVPRWLIIANIFFLVVLLYYIFYLNDQYYHQK